MYIQRSKPLFRWGVEVPTYLTGLTIVNDAISGSSSRSYARDGHFYNLVHNQLQAGDC